RLSNFLLWQAAYSEFHSTQTLWPDFGEADFEGALASYQRRVRRFGARPEEISNRGRWGGGPPAGGSGGPPLQHAGSGRHGGRLDRGRAGGPDRRLYLGLCGDGDRAGRRADRILAADPRHGHAGTVMAAVSAELRLTAQGPAPLLG